MLCFTCGAENPAEQKFCNECAAPFKRRCAKCGYENAPAARFCGECAAALTSDLSKSATRIPSTPSVRIAPEQTVPDAADGERKTVTALFADIKGSMELMEDLDPEEARAIIDPALRLMIDAAHRYDGYIVQSTGDGIFALFGAPVAHEDHPQRALYAALRMQEDLKRYSDRIRAEGGLPIQVRVGVNTGAVLVRSLRTGEAHTEYAPIGHSTSLAARMQALAPIGSVAVAESTQKLCAGYFNFNPLGPTRIKGVSGPVNVYEVTGLGPLRTRLQRSAARGLTRFVGRHREMDALKHAAELAKQGHGQIAAAMAEAGVGKSRLFFEFKAVTAAGWMVLETFSVSHGKASAYLPVIELLRGYFKIVPTDDERTRREKVTGRVVALDRNLEDTLPYLFALLGIIEDDDPLAQMDAQIKRRRTLEAIKRLLLRESLNQPLIVIFEDLHWIDEETQALLNLLADSIGTAKVLMLVNYRPEYTHGWGNKACYAHLRLDPLGKESAEEMLSALLDAGLTSPGERLRARHPLLGQGEGPGSAPLPDQGEAGEAAPSRVRASEGGIAGLKRLIIDKTEGNPFFMEEMVQALREDGALAGDGTLTRPLSELKVPATVQAILASRIDRLPAGEKNLLQTLAVIGREFPLGLVERILHPDAPEQLERMLSELQLGEFIYEQPAAGDVEYSFKHALTQEVAYGSIPAAGRKSLHERIGAAIEARFPDQLDDHLSALAHHYGRSANPRKAVEYLGRAGRQALERSAFNEANANLSAGLKLLKAMPEDLERARQELALQSVLGQLLLIQTGSASSVEVEERALRACELARLVNDESELIGALFALRLCYMVRGELSRSRETAEQMLALAEGQPGELAMAHFAMGFTLLRIGDFEGSVAHCEQALAIPESAGHSVVLLSFVKPKVAFMSLLAHPLSCLGFPDRARKLARQALAMAREGSRPFDIVLALASDLELQQALRNGPLGLQQADAAISLAAETGVVSQLARLAAPRGWALVESGRVEEGIAQLRMALAGAEALNVGLVVAALCALAEAYRKLGQHEDGTEILRKALALMEKTGERQYEAEVHRLKGDLMSLADDSAVAAAQACYRTAIEVARAQRAKWWELRATVSLARILADNGHRDEARAMLADIYGWFTEGFDTVDLTEAKVLLGELSAG